MRFSADRSCYFRTMAFALGAAFAAFFLLAAQLEANGTLYLIDGTNLYTVDTGTAAPTLVGPAFDDGLAPSEDPWSYLYCADNNPDLYSLPLDGSAQSLIATISGDANRGLAFNTTTGVLYGTDNSVFGSIDQSTGAFTPLASPPSEPEALAADPDNDLVYGLETGGDPDLMVYDVSTGMWSVIGSTTVADGGKAGLAFDPIAEILYASDRDGSGNLYSIDPATGATTWIGSTGLGDEGTGLAFVPFLPFNDGFESGDTGAWSTAQGVGTPPATCAELVTTMDVWGLSAAGLDLRSRTNSTLHWLGCPTDGCDPAFFYCVDDPVAQTLAFGTTLDALRTLVDPGNAIGDTIPASYNGCCSASAPNDICNAPDSDCNGQPVDCIAALCHALGYQNGVLVREVVDNSCPEPHALDIDGTDWTSDYMFSAGYGAEYLCSGFLE